MRTTRSWPRTPLASLRPRLQALSPATPRLVALHGHLPRVSSALQTVRMPLVSHTVSERAAPGVATPCSDLSLFR